MAKDLECLICRLRYSKQEVLAEVYCIETFVCYHCYAHMQSQPHHVSCFGKPTVILKTMGDKKLLGYNPKADVCQRICPDRKLCSKVVCGLS